MFLTVHSAVGAAIGNAIPNPIVSFVLGVISHFVLDRIPHLDPDVTLEPGPFRLTASIKKFIAIAAVDSFIVLAMTVFLLSKNPPHAVNLAAGIGGSILPDYIMGLAIITNNKYLKKFQAFHKWCHFDKTKIPVNLYTGSVTQIATWLFAFWLMR